MEKTTERLFFALEIDAPSKQKIIHLMNVLKRQQVRDVPLRWTPQDNLHITLRFIGETVREKQSTYVDAVREVLCHTSPFYIKTTRLFCLPSPRHPRLIALGVEKISELEALFDRVNSVLVALGVAEEKHPFTPHITLVKSKHHPEAIAALLKGHHSVEVIQQKVERLTLFRTDHLEGSSGSVYTPIESIIFA